MKVREKFIDDFALALYQIALEKNKSDNYLDIANDLIDVFKNYPQYIKLLSNTYISKEERKSMIKALFENNIDEDLLHSLYLLIDREAFISVRVILKKLRKLINVDHHIQYGNVYSVVPLSKEQIKKIEAKLTKKLGFNVELVNKIDPNLIGGVKVRVRHEIIDGSLLGQLKDMKEKMS